jgi:hypothetical protein
MKYSFLFLSIIFFLSFSSCKEDPCETTDCGTYGSCILVSDEATCRCDEGFEQDESGKCTIFSIIQYPGSYTATETCTSKLTGSETNQSYTLDISLFSTREIILSNIGNQACTNKFLEVRALIEGNDFVFLAGTYCKDEINQTEYNLSGDGEISEDGISFEYEMSYSQFGTVTLNNACSVTLSKQ